MNTDEDIEISKGVLGHGRVAVHVERQTGYGRVPGLEDEELAEPEELERQVMLAEWGPILALPVRSSRRGFRPTADESGNLDGGAFGTVDFLRDRPAFDKARYKADKLEEELRNAVIMVGIVAARLPAGVVSRIQQQLRDPAVGSDSFADGDEHGFARWYLRAKRLRTLIRELRAASYRRRAMAQSACEAG